MATRVKKRPTRSSARATETAFAIAVAAIAKSKIRIPKRSAKKLMPHTAQPIFFRGHKQQRHIVAAERAVAYATSSSYSKAARSAAVLNFGSNTRTPQQRLERSTVHSLQIRNAPRTSASRPTMPQITYSQMTACSVYRIPVIVSVEHHLTVLGHEIAPAKPGIRSEPSDGHLYQ
jgi:hypothetical protein